MKFKSKIFLVCISVYVITLVITTIAVTEKNYRMLLDNEIQRSIKEQTNIKSNISLFLLTNRKLSKDRMDIGAYSEAIVDMYGTEEIQLELYTSSLKLLSSSSSSSIKLEREELSLALSEGRNYILRNIDGKFYLFITDVVQSDSGNAIVAFIKDITYVKLQRIQQYQFFAQFGVIGLILVGVFINFTGMLVIKPIEGLTLASINITAGNYKERVEVKSRDEVGMLAMQFNVMADEIEKKVEDLKLEGEKKQRFIDNLTHELRTPLTSIIGYSDLLLKIKYDEAMFVKSLGYINAEGKRMMNMVTTLMHLILTREGKLMTERIHIHSLFEEVINVMHVKASGKDVALEMKGENLQFFANKDLIKEALLNLVDNALNVSEEGMKITLGVEDDINPIIYVMDEGKGISQEDIAKITEPFYRVDKSRTRKEGGMGLGLSIVNEIIKIHNAEFQIESEIGKGTIMKIIFKHNSIFK